MMERYVIIALPIIWAVVSTVIALILYKSSDALFEQRFPVKSERRRVKLVGSIVIAAIVFLGLAKFTDLSPFSDISKNQRRVLVSTLGEHRHNLVVLRNAYEEMNGCVSVTTADQCEQYMIKLEAGLEGVERSFNDVDPPHK